MAQQQIIAHSVNLVNLISFTNTMEHKTPVKENATHQAMMTPSPVSREDDPHLLIESLSAMKINHGKEQEVHEFDDLEPLGRAKRHFSERFTVEGSPFISGADLKRRDVLPTPAKVSFNIDPIAEEVPRLGALSDIPVLSPLAVATVSVTLEGTNTPVTSTAATPISSVPSTSKDMDKRKVLVICSASDEHDTGNHQENALRTALLCGPEGCLRRPALADFMEWIDTDKLSSPPVTDLLRVHEFEYLDHLERKCRKEVNHLPYFYAPQGLLDTDTPLVPQSYEAAKRFCR